MQNCDFAYYIQCLYQFSYAIAGLLDFNIIETLFRSGWKKMQVKKYRRFTFVGLPIFHALYAFAVLPFRYLRNERYKNDNFLKNVVCYLSSERYKNNYGRMFFGVYPLLK
jgi:hypothetical protein